MDQEKLRTLHLLEEIENNQIPSQRYLAKKLNVSLGLTNSFIKRLASKGYFKINTIPKNRVKYILTPKGAAEKTRLTYEYIHYSFKFYKRARQNFKELFPKLVNEGVQSVVFYGASELGEIAYVSLQETAIDLIAVIDDKKIGKRYLGKVIIDPAKLASLFFDRILITESGPIDGFMDKILTTGIPRNKVILLG